MKHKFKIAICSLALLLGVIAGVYQNEQNKYSQITVKAPAGIKLDVYPDLGGDGPFHYDDSTPPITRVVGTNQIKVKQGVYDFVVVGPQENYNNPVTKAEVVRGQTSIEISPSYSEQRLASLLPASRQLARQALEKRYPLVRQNYVISSDKLFGLGDWYGAVLTPKTLGYDTLRVLVKKSPSGIWEVKTRPSISIGQPSNPDIPSDVLSGIDGL